MKPLFGGFIAIILLCLFEYTVYEAIIVAKCVATTGCTTHPAADFTLGFAHAMNLIGGLVSALVIAELAVTEPGKSPVGAAIVSVSAGRPTLGQIAWIITVLYLLVWVFTGLAAYVVGTMWWPQALQPLTDLGQGWLGLAVAAAYAYFGISPAGGGGTVQAATQPAPTVQGAGH
jgi:hypothetical protein